MQSGAVRNIEIAIVIISGLNPIKSPEVIFLAKIEVNMFDKTSISLTLIATAMAKPRRNEKIVAKKQSSRR